MESAKSRREVALGVIPQVANSVLLAEGPKCREPTTGNLVYPRKCSLSSEESRRGRQSICGKMDIPALLNVPLEYQPGALGRRRGAHQGPVLAAAGD